MSTSPSLRFSLRRKRSTRSGENSGSPAVKKSSPTLPEAKKEPPSTPKTHNSRRTTKVTRSATRSSPRFSRRGSTDRSDNEEKNLTTPVALKWTQANDQSLRQPSPDMPFMSSQLCGTQECEVVWDCDSPGFSKDDLKRMHSGRDTEGPENIVAIIQPPPRQLFPQPRTRLSKASSSRNTTTQLNDLLDLLSSKENAGKRKNESEENPHGLLKNLEQVVPPKDNYSEDSSSSELLVLPKPLRDASSQPFEVPTMSSAKDSNKTTSLTELDDSVWGDDLNLGMCDISDSVLDGDRGTRSSREGCASLLKDQADQSRVLTENAEVSSASVDVFDDDLFSESVILSTQAVEEEALTTKNAKNVTNKSSYSGASYSKESHDKLNNHIPKVEENVRNVNNVTNISKNSNKSEPSIYNKLTTSNLSTNGINVSKVNHKSGSSDSPLRRQVRRSFRFGPSPTDIAKSSVSVVTDKTQYTINSVPDIQRSVKTNKTRCELKKNLLPAFNIKKPSTKQNTHLPGSNLVNVTSKTPSISCNTRPQGTLPMMKKPLFRTETKTEETKNRSTAQGTRGPLLRSQSIGNARLTTSSPVARRSNSSMELDTSQDLEDDEFFKSLLSRLPEDEGGLPSDSTLPLSPITTDNKSCVSHSSKNSGHSRLAIGNNRHTSNALLQNNVRNDSVRTHSVGVKVHPGVTKPKVRPAASVQGMRPGGTNYSSAKTKPPDTAQPRPGGSKEQQTNDTFDDDLFEDDVLSLIDEVESQFGSQNAPSGPSPSPSPQQSSQPQIKCSQEEIARKRAAALQMREKRRQQCR